MAGRYGWPARQRQVEPEVVGRPRKGQAACALPAYYRGFSHLTRAGRESMPMIGPR